MQPAFIVVGETNSQRRCALSLIPPAVVAGALEASLVSRPHLALGHDALGGPPRPAPGGEPHPCDSYIVPVARLELGRWQFAADRGQPGACDLNAIRFKAHDALAAHQVTPYERAEMPRCNIAIAEQNREVVD